MIVDSAATRRRSRRAGKWLRDILAIHENADSYRNSCRPERGRDPETACRAGETTGCATEAGAIAPVAHPGAGPELFCPGDHRLRTSENPANARPDNLPAPS